ncbi:MAG: YbfB/YjiJ family MFS transporter [Burkholderiaceae bacterium]|nr:YbfB/YjiJ family MFS transporter [Burkholderiaceae bacterium]
MSPTRIVLLATGLSLGPTVSNSFARFAYALVLPAMREDLAFNFSQAGFLNTANAFGYLLGAILTRLLVNQWGNKNLFRHGMILTAAALLLTGLVHDLWALALCRFAGGVGGAAVFICGGVLAGNIVAHDPKWSTRCITLYFGGAGIGLMLCGAVIPAWLDHTGPPGWADIWIAMGLTAAAMSVASQVCVAQIAEPSHASGSAAWPLKPMLPAFLSYICFGLGYIVYMTFIIAWVRSQGLSTTQVAAMWSLLGLTTILSPLVWSGPMAKWRGGRPMAAVMLTLGVGAGLPIVPLPPEWQFFGIQCSAALFGLGMFSAPASISTLIKHSLPKPAWGSAMATFTIAFGLSQVVAPLTSGWMADLSGSLRGGLTLSAAIILIGVGLALLQRPLIHLKHQ